jgi:hypothetical protein
MYMARLQVQHDQSTNGVEMMKPLTAKPTQITLTVMLVGLISLACTLSQFAAQAPTSKTTGTAQPAPNGSASTGQKTPATNNIQEDITHPDPMDHLLALNSIQINLTITRPDSSSQSTQIAIDNTGNMDVKFTENAPDTENMPKGFDPKAIKTDSELLVVDGKAYLSNDLDPTWMSTPIAENYPVTLAQELHGMDGPSLWLNMLPDGSIQPAGQDLVGGFAVDKYIVNGKVDNQTISGTLWEEPQSDALIQAELHIPGALLSDPDQPQPGELKIVLNAQKADVPAVTLPAAQAGTVQPPATP